LVLLALAKSKGEARTGQGIFESAWFKNSAGIFLKGLPFGKMLAFKEATKVAEVMGVHLRKLCSGVIRIAIVR
jgi:hypothetical protein